MKRVCTALLVAALTLGGCGGTTGGGEHAGHDEGGDAGAAEHGGGVPGEAADPADADREVRVVTTDELRFDPASIDVAAGEVVTFVIVNKGKIQHEFVLGDATYQEVHGEDMAEGGDHGSMENAVTVAPGEAAELTWRFSDAGEVLYGCHEPGHYDGGMVGTIDVS